MTGTLLTILLSDAGASMLASAPRIPGSPWVIPSKKYPHKHKADLHREWAALREASNVSDAIIHDPGRTFGARIARTAGLRVAQKLLRHSDIKITESAYAPIDEEALREAIDILNRR